MPTALILVSLVVLSRLRELGKLATHRSLGWSSWGWLVAVCLCAPQALAQRPAQNPLSETRYGFFEGRAQLQRSPGVWGAFWIQSTEIAKGEDPAVYGAEIDILEFFKKLGTDIVSHNVHWAYGPHQKTTHGMQSYRPGVSDGFHTFALEWTPEKYVFFVDGNKYYEVTQGLSKIEEYLILSMELPSEPNDIKNTILPDVFTVDYVKVYKKKTITP